MLVGALLWGGVAYAIALLPTQQAGTGLGGFNTPANGAILFGGDNIKLATSSNLTFATSTNTLTTNNLTITGTCVGCGNGSTFPFTPFTNFGVAGVSTSTPVSFLSGINASTTSQFAQASTTNIGASGSAYFATSGGNVGIGTTSPTYLLSVGGASGTTIGNGYFSGNVVANNFYDLTLGGTTCVGESAGLLNSTNCVQSIASSGSTISVSSPTGAVNVDLNLGHSNTWSVLQTFTNATSTLLTATTELNIPHSGTVPTLSQGDIYQNTNSTASSSIQTSESPLFNVHSVSTVLASSTLVYMGSFGASGTTTLPVVNSLHTTTIQSFGCTTDVGTAWVAFGTGLATTTAVQCSSTGKFITVSSNNVFKGRQLIKMDVGTSATSPNTITITADVEDSN